ncbi:protein FAM184A isoform X2 [Austrofundulus limnaeus]|uniref:Protein FAM184A isoform X2 n=1 Tax=Austrofundulus limnaeus TaxID=52670 RepID=A0A2I4C685_AUSLI|nr:PREDICTED: protein FAM184A-like isoform X2 [Austrofundulus limnaeus]
MPRKLLALGYEPTVSGASEAGRDASRLAWGQDWAGSTSSGSGGGKCSSCPASSGMFYDGSLTLEYTQDLHLKMSKKIAQLTKVIYALNTKNDEHEEEIESLKEAHEDEVQHIVTETRDKIMQYKSKMADEADLRRRLASLEESVELHEHMKRQVIRCCRALSALAEFEMYRQRMEDSQLCTEAQHTQRVVSMSREVEEMRRDFEEKLRTFSQAQAQFEADKRRALDEMRATHRQEVEELRNNQQNHSATSAEDQEKLAELHRQEVESLMERVEELTKDKVRLVEEYEAKLAKAQEYYERELEAMRRTHQLTTENLLAWKRTEVELRKEFQAQEAALQRSLSKLRSELQKAQEEARENRDKTNRLQTSLANAEGTIKNLHKQLEEAIQDGEIWVMQLKDTEYELESSRERVQQQATEILHKASQIGSLQATQMAHEATIRNLDQEQSRLKEKISRLEEGRESLLNQSQAANEQHKQQVVKLEQSLREEHQGYEKELSRLRAHYEEETLRYKEAQVRALEELEDKHRTMREEAHHEKEEEKKLLINKMSQEFEIKRLSLEEQRDRLQQQLDNLKEELTAKVNMANQEVSHLQEMVREGEQNLNSAQTQISCLKETQDKLRIELDATRARVRETSNLLTDLQEEIETQKQQHEARVMAIRTEEKQKMDKMADDLDQKWRDALREEVRLLREELTEEYEADKQAALTQLSQQKELELMAAREGWQRKVEDLLEQISLLKQSLELQLTQSQSSLQQLQSQFNQERELLSQQLKEMQREHQRREHRLQEAHCCALSTMEEARQHQIRALEERLKQEQREEVHALKEAHRRTLEILRQQSEQELQTLRYELEDEGKAKLASLRAELNHLHATAIEHLKQIHLKENNVAKRELEKAMEHSHKQEQELLVRLSDLQGELCSRSNRITDLDHEIHSLNETIDTLTRELELKGKEVLRVRSEANHQIRAHEQDLGKRHDRDLEELRIVHHREAQIMLADFNKAQEVLRDKISALQILLEGTEEKLRNRESRPEDLHLIAELREMVTEREALVKKLVDDKKFYQLELVNRETGFNKVFNSSANVGVINPLIKSKTGSQSDWRPPSFPSHSALRIVSPPATSREGQEQEGQEVEEVGPGGCVVPPHSPLQRSLPRLKKALPLFSPPLPPHPSHHPTPPPHAPQDPHVQHQALQVCRSLPEANAATPSDSGGTEEEKSKEYLTKEEELYSQYFTF